MKYLLALLFLFDVDNGYAFTRYVYSEAGKLKVQYQATQQERTVFATPEVEKHYLRRLNNLDQVVSPSQARELISFFLYSTPIPFNYVEDYCFARAHEMAQTLELMGVQSEKIIAEGNLSVRDYDGKAVSWKYHIAPTLKVLVDGVIQTRVIDPSLSHDPLTVQEWFLKMASEPCISKGRFEWYDIRGQECVYYQVPRFYYRSQDLWQDYQEWQPNHLNDAYEKIMDFL